MTFTEGVSSRIKKLKRVSRELDLKQVRATPTFTTHLRDSSDERTSFLQQEAPRRLHWYSTELN